VNLSRSKMGYEKIPTSALRLRREIQRPFASPIPIDRFPGLRVLRTRSEASSSEIPAWYLRAAMKQSRGVKIVSR
jgi:hypothetical protein